ncbi:PHB depolymerase family esterase [Streptomyces sp. MspMP-M5]|uniref:extracellular catalytic domain type 1 short-chain-length polyhydroxyalkanoate depolymerase n=1 Tax=unclassified Streptomyces TaxID=2593676 RepID=UPI001928BFC1|nr:PHB depolymerase family esterase [Streptomyces sp. MspMP-M5]
MLQRVDRPLDFVPSLVDRQALNPDFALVRAHPADRHGNLALHSAARKFNPLCAMAARTTLVAADHIVESGAIPPGSVHLPGIHVDRIVAVDPHDRRIERRTVRPSPKCFNWYDPAKSSRGRGEALSIKQMVDKAVAQYGSDTRRVYITGLSAGGAMTADMLADYPDAFAAGSIDSGVPAFCANSRYSALTCRNSPTGKTPAQWGDLVRAAAPTGTTSWPRVAIRHGTSDTTVNPANATESHDQWTNVWGIGQRPSRTQNLPGGTTLSIYYDTTGKPAVEVYSISGMGHGLAVNPGSGTDQCGTTGTYYLNSLCSSYYTATFWGLAGSSGTAEPGKPGTS